MKRVAVSAMDLLALLEREFERRRPRGCDACAPSMPFPVQPRDPSAPNWEMVPLGTCSLLCVRVLEDIAAELQRVYALAS